MDTVFHEKEHEKIDATLQDHETRLKDVEKQGIETKFTLLDIQKSQADLKVMFMENQKNYKDSMESFMNKLLETITSTVKTNNNNSSKITKSKLTMQEKIFALIITIVNIGGSILVNVIK